MTATHDTLAEHLLAPGSQALYLLHRLCDFDEKWETLSRGALLKLGQRYGAATVVTALQELRLHESTTWAPYPLLDAVCKALVRERA